jgi:hypothetical protein
MSNNENEKEKEDESSVKTRILSAIQLFKQGSRNSLGSLQSRNRITKVEPIRSPIDSPDESKNLIQNPLDCSVKNTSDETCFSNLIYGVLNRVSSWFTGTAKSTVVVPEKQKSNPSCVRLHRNSVSFPNLNRHISRQVSRPESIRENAIHKIQSMERRVVSAPNLIVREESWRPPSRHGLENSHRIIPHYYFTNHNYDEIFEIDYLHIILDDIRNLRKLNKYQIEYIMELDEYHKKIVIDEFFHVNNMLLDTIDGIA